MMTNGKVLMKITVLKRLVVRLSSGVETNVWLNYQH